MSYAVGGPCKSYSNIHFQPKSKERLVRHVWCIEENLTHTQSCKSNPRFWPRIYQTLESIPLLGLLVVWNYMINMFEYET
jgi:hypothetical protein